MRAWRVPAGPAVPAALCAGLLAAQLLPLPALMDVATGGAPSGLRLSFPVGHVLLAPLTLLADWLAGCARRELVAFACWALGLYVLARVWVALRRPRSSLAPLEGGSSLSSASALAEARPWQLLALREALAMAGFLAALAAFLAWCVWAPRPIPRLLAGDPAALVFDIHSHTETSHDGRRGFTAQANAAWHARAGFHAAFVTDHNRARADLLERVRAQPPGVRARSAILLPGEELSLFRTHIVALGVSGEISPAGLSHDYDSMGVLLPRLRAQGVFLVASLPEYWRYHPPGDLDDLERWGVEGYEIWTTSPMGMDLPPRLRRRIIARATERHLALFGATDMHGLGRTASVWNVMPLPRWRELAAAELSRALITRFRFAGPRAVRVVALRRWVGDGWLGRVFSPPVNAVVQLRAASPAHAVLLAVWLWAPYALSRLGRRLRRS